MSYKAKERFSLSDPGFTTDRKNGFSSGLFATEKNRGSRQNMLSQYIVHMVDFVEYLCFFSVSLYIL